MKRGLESKKLKERFDKLADDIFSTAWFMVSKCKSKMSDARRIEFESVVVDHVDIQEDILAVAANIHKDGRLVVDVESFTGLYDMDFKEFDIEKQLRILEAIEKAIEKEARP